MLIKALVGKFLAEIHARIMSDDRYQERTTEGR